MHGPQEPQNTAADGPDPTLILEKLFFRHMAKKAAKMNVQRVLEEEDWGAGPEDHLPEATVRVLAHLEREGLIAFQKAKPESGILPRTAQISLTDRGTQKIRPQCDKDKQRFLYEVFKSGGGGAKGLCNVADVGKCLGFQGYLPWHIPEALAHEDFVELRKRGNENLPSGVAITEFGISQLTRFWKTPLYWFRVTAKRQGLALISIVLAALAAIGTLANIVLRSRAPQFNVPPSAVSVTVPVPEVRINLPAPDIPVRAVNEKTNDEPKPAAGKTPPNPDAEKNTTTPDTGQDGPAPEPTEETGQ